MRNKIKIQAIVTVNEDGHYNICGWNDEKSPKLKDMASLSLEGLDYSNARAKQYLLETEVEIPSFENEKLDESNIKIEEYNP